VQSEKLNILVIDNSPGWTGAIKSILNSSKNINADFTFAIPKRSQLVPYFKENKIKFIEVSFLEIRKHWSVIFYLPMLLYNSIVIARFCKKNAIQIIHTNDLYNLAGVFSGIFNPSTKLIHHIRLLPGSYVSFFYRFWIKCLAKFANEIITVSETSKSCISKYTDRKIIVIYDSVVAPKISIRGRNDSFVHFLYPANYTAGKGQEFALQAFAEVVKENPNIFLTFVGGDLGLPKNIAFKEKLRKNIQLLALENNVKLGDFEPNIFELMSNHDVVLNFSESESFSMVCLEALLMEKVLIATDSGGPKELFENGKSGFLVDRDIQTIKSKMVLVANDTVLRREIGIEGKRFASLKFDHIISANRLEEIYLSQVTNTHD
jgi:L-malate glycosyltransferase